METKILLVLMIFWFIYASLQQQKQQPKINKIKLKITNFAVAFATAKFVMWE